MSNHPQTVDEVMYDACDSVPGSNRTHYWFSLWDNCLNIEKAANGKPVAPRVQLELPFKT